MRYKFILNSEPPTPLPPPPDVVLILLGLVYACAGDSSRLPDLLRTLRSWLGDSWDRRINDRRELSSIAEGLREIQLSDVNGPAAMMISPLLPHFEQALLLKKRLDHAPAAHASASELLKLMPFPCLFTDHKSRCVERNAAFEDAQQQLSVRLAVGRIQFVSTSLQDTWISALAEVYQTATGQTIFANFTDGKPWQIHLVPLHTIIQTGNDRLNMVMAVFDDRPVDPRLKVQALHSQAHLTSAEGEVLASLLQGRSAKVIANQRKASVNTVRVQIMAILDKTGYASQRELMAAFGDSSFGGVGNDELTSSFKPSGFAG